MGRGFHSLSDCNFSLAIDLGHWVLWSFVSGIMWCKKSVTYGVVITSKLSNQRRLSGSTLKCDQNHGHILAKSIRKIYKQVTVYAIHNRNQCLYLRIKRLVYEQEWLVMFSKDTKRTIRRADTICWKLWFGSYQILF
jgi:hypothetical protein